MQTIQFFQTVKWIQSQFSESTIKFFLMAKPWKDRMEEQPEYPMDVLLRISHEIANVQPKLVSHPFAPGVLNAFGLGYLLDLAFPADFAAGFFSRGEKRFKEVDEIGGHLHVMIECIEPIQKITTPPAIIDEKDFDEILTVELRCGERFDPSTETISEMLKSINIIYIHVAKMQGAEGAGNLSTLYIASGSDYRFDFKGLGEPIREIKKLLVEAWDRVRHRKAEDLHSNKRAVLSGLKTLERIKSGRDKKLISDEDADKLCDKIITSMLDIFGKGVLIREIPSEEIVSNQQLIEGIQQKRLPPAVVKQLPEGKAGKKGVKIKKVKEKGVRKKGTKK